MYPGATHTRFDHALGVYHLTVRALRHLRDVVPEGSRAWRGADLVPYAALLHDIGHYPFSHALEELPNGVVPGGHEAVGRRFLASPQVREVVRELGEGAEDAIHGLVSGSSDLPLSGLVSGGLDMDKMEYLCRDARFCGVPYGEVDVSRLLEGLAVLRDPDGGRYELGVREKAASALESLLFAKYQMFRNVYWHHAVRAATCLYKRIVEDAVRCALIDPHELVGPTDEGLMHDIRRRADQAEGEVPARLATRWLPALRNRKLPRRALELTAADLSGANMEAWAHRDPLQRRDFEDDLAAELDLEPGEVMIDFPSKPAMFQLDLLVERRGGTVERLGHGGLPGVIDLPSLARQLHDSARVLRIFTFERRTLEARAFLECLATP